MLASVYRETLERAPLPYICRPAPCRHALGSSLRAMARPPAFSGETPFEVTPNGVRLRVRLTPRGGRDGLDGVGELPGGLCVARIRVAAAPVDGAANAALTAFLARALDLRKSDLRIASGESGRIKSVDIAGDPARIAAVLSAWLSDD